MTAPETDAPALRGATDFETDIRHVRNLACLLRFALEAGGRYGLDDETSQGAALVADVIADASSRLGDDFRALFAAGAFPSQPRGRNRP